MARKKKEERRRSGSFFINAVDAFTAFIYSFLKGGETSRKVLTDDSYYRESRTAHAFEKNARSLVKDSSIQYIGTFLEQSTTMRAAGAFRSFLAALSLNVYGIFSIVYGLVSIVMYYLSYVLNGKNEHGASALLFAGILIVCAVPMLMTSRSAVSVLAESVIMRKILLSFLGLPVEKLNTRKQIGGNEYMLLSAFLAILFGIFTYFVHVLYIPILFGVVVMISLISSHPEAGVVITVAVAPFLQFTNEPELILAVLILGTMASYVGKLIRHRRTVIFSAECILVFLFCAFILASSIFAVGGAETLQESVLTIIVIVGGFFLTYSLMETEKRLAACMRILTVSFISLCLAGLWNLFYNGIADGVIYSMRESVRPIFENNIIYIADDASVFGVFAVLMTPLIFAYMAKRKSATGFASALAFLAVIVFAAFIYGTYETVVAIVIEFFLFWLIYSHKTMTALIFLALPVAILAMLYPYAATRYDLPEIGELFKGLLPLGFADSSAHLSVIEHTVEMLKDGNLMGIGAGKHAFEAVYPAYADAVSAGADNPASLWLQIICWSGVGGMAVFVVLALLIARNSLGQLSCSRERTMRPEVLALFCSVFTAMIFGSVNCIWDDVRMLYLFWTCVGLLAAYIREAREAEDRKLADYARDDDNTDIELRF
ncbi:MAG: hypothetical protein IJY39_08920 [Clostridia bacterium]|nr:hypothetical protein [Clostridia bacterium]